MKYTVWCRGVLLGTTHLAAVNPAAPNIRSGQLDTTVEFNQLWPEIAPLFDEALAATIAIGSVVAELPSAAEGVDPLERGRQIYEHISGHPNAARVRTANAALASLGLELHDEDGNRVATDFMMVSEVKPPDDIPAEAIAAHVEEARRLGMDIRIPFYIVTVR